MLATLMGMSPGPHAESAGDAWSRIDGFFGMHLAVSDDRTRARGTYASGWAGDSTVGAPIALSGATRVAG